MSDNQHYVNFALCGLFLLDYARRWRVSGVGSTSGADGEESAAELPVGTVFAPNQVEVQVAESTLVLQAGYALAALPLDLDGDEPNDALVASADADRVRLQAVYPRGLDVKIMPNSARGKGRLREIM